MVSKRLHNKKGSRAAFDDHISCYPVAKDGYNKYFDKILKIKNVKVLFRSIANKFNLKNKTAYINGKKNSFDIIINTIAPDEILNFKYGRLGFIGRDFHKIVLPLKEIF